MIIAIKIATAIENESMSSIIFASCVDVAVLFGKSLVGIGVFVGSAEVVINPKLVPKITKITHQAAGTRRL